jgi:hypothetical protein
MSDWPEAQKRLEQLATSTIVGADIRAALAEIDRLTTGLAECERELALGRTTTEAIKAIEKVRRAR